MPYSVQHTQQLLHILLQFTISYLPSAIHIQLILIIPLSEFGSRLSLGHMDHCENSGHLFSVPIDRIHGSGHTVRIQSKNSDFGKCGSLCWTWGDTGLSLVLWFIVVWTTLQGNLWDSMASTTHSHPKSICHCSAECAITESDDNRRSGTVEFGIGIGCKFASNCLRWKANKINSTFFLKRFWRPSIHTTRFWCRAWNEFVVQSRSIGAWFAGCN